MQKASISSIRRQIEKMQAESENAEKKIRSALNGLDFEVASKQNIRNCLNTLITSANRQGSLSGQYKTAFLNVTNSVVESDGKFGNQSQSICDRIKKYVEGAASDAKKFFFKNKIAKYAALAGMFLTNPVGVVTTCAIFPDSTITKEYVKAGKKCASAVRKEFLDEKGKFDYEKAKLYGKAALKVGKSVVKIVGAVGAIATGVGIPVAILSIVSAGNDFVNGMTDVAMIHEGLYDQVGKTNVLKDYIVEGGKNIGRIIGNEDIGETIGNAIYTGIDVVTFLDGADKMLTSLGKANTVLTGQYGSSSVIFGDPNKVSFDAIENTKLKFDFEPDYFIRKITKVNPASDGNIIYEAGKSIFKMFSKASKLGKQIGSLI